MSAFLLAAALLAAVAVVLVLRPLFSRPRAKPSRDEANVAVYRDQLRELDADLAAGTLAQADYERSRREIEARVLDDVAGPADPHFGPGKRTAIALVVAIPLVAALVYLATGNPRALDPSQAAGFDEAQLEAMVARLARKLRERPDDAEGWKLLGRSYAALGRFPDSVAAFARAAQLQPRDAQLLTDFAEVLAMARGQRLAGEPEQLLARALEIDPMNLKALALSGTAAFERQDYPQAAALWGRMLPLVPPGSDEARTIAQSVEETRKLAGIGAHPGVRGTVRLAPGLKDKVRPDDTVFVFARAVDGPKVPLAVLRITVRDLPYRFALNDAMAMQQGVTVSAFPRVIVAARISKSGRPQPGAGDYEGASKPVANDAAGVTVLIESAVR
jgi:cytochrome c-type biogenesis protein CcmH